MNKLDVLNRRLRELEQERTALVRAIHELQKTLPRCGAQHPSRPSVRCTLPKDHETKSHEHWIETDYGYELDYIWGLFDYERYKTHDT